jgi:dGTPase
VFLSPNTESLRTRLTHTIEVAQIARTIANALRLNEDLTEAIALGHDLGHPPFGHTGEKTLNSMSPEGFRHNEQSLRVVDILEKNGEGLNLTVEVRDGILKHSRGRISLKTQDTEDNMPLTLEGVIVRLADSIAYINHDIADAISAKIITIDDLPKDAIEILGYKHSTRINTMVLDVIQNSWNYNVIQMSPEVLEATDKLRNYLYEHVYPNPKIQKEADKAQRVLRELFEYYYKHPEIIYTKLSFLPSDTHIERMICDYISDMSDREALLEYEEIFLPKPWLEGR